MTEPTQFIQRTPIGLVRVAIEFLEASTIRAHKIWWSAHSAVYSYQLLRFTKIWRFEFTLSRTENKFDWLINFDLSKGETVGQTSLRMNENFKKESIQKYH